MSGNAFSGGDNKFVVEHMALSCNTFERAGGDAGTTIGKTGIYLGNFAPDDIRLFSIVVTNIASQPITTIAPNSLERNLNLVINIVES